MTLWGTVSVQDCLPSDIWLQEKKKVTKESSIALNCCWAFGQVVVTRS